MKIKLSDNLTIAASSLANICGTRGRCRVAELFGDRVVIQCSDFATRPDWISECSDELLVAVDLVERAKMQAREISEMKNRRVAGDGGQIDDEQCLLDDLLSQIRKSKLAARIDKISRLQWRS